MVGDFGIANQQRDGFPQRVPETETASLLQRIIWPRISGAIAASLACPMCFQFWTQICRPTQFTLDKATGARSVNCIGVLGMGTEHLPRNKQGHLAEPSLWVGEPAAGTLSLLEENALREDEPSLWGDEHGDDMHSLLEENARLRGLLVQLSDLIRRNVVHAR